MSSYLIITAVGPDRPGLVDELSAQLAAQNINIESSRMAVLGGEFAIILLASGNEAKTAALAADPPALGARTGLQVFIKKTAAPSARVVPASLPFRIVTAGMDHPGIVHEISAVLHRFEVNIEALDTKVVPAPVSGAPMFMMEADLAVPAAVKIKRLREALAELSDQLNMDIEFEPVEKLMGLEDARELRELLAGLTAELEDRRAALPAHSVRPGQMIAIEELEAQIRELQRKIKQVESEP